MRGHVQLKIGLPIPVNLQTYSNQLKIRVKLWQPNRTEIIHEEENNYIKNKIIQLKSLFPEVFCEEKIDFEKLKLILGADNLADADERYQLNWAGKTAAYLNLQSPTSNTPSFPAKKNPQISTARKTCLSRPKISKP